MFGYVLPDALELKVKELERFKACYCGLCHELGDRYGIASRFILNYDFTFLAMLMWTGDSADYGFRRCIPSLCRRRCVSKSCAAISVSAGYSVILSYWKINDSIIDEYGFKKLGAKFAKLFLKRAYKKASDSYKDFDSIVRENLSALLDFERDNEVSLDKCAEKFATILSAAANIEDDVGIRRAKQQLLYHVGRIIYIADAYNDIHEDLEGKRKKYNPIAARYSLSSAVVPKDVSISVLQTLKASLSMVYTAYELLPRNYWSPVMDNIVYIGIPNMCDKVIEGKYQINYRKLKKKVFKDMLPERSENLT